MVCWEEGKGKNGEISGAVREKEEKCREAGHGGKTALKKRGYGLKRIVVEGREKGGKGLNKGTRRDETRKEEDSDPDYGGKLEGTLRNHIRGREAGIE